jgi:drug/metabolite transporter (DMT)-like permease
MLTRMKAGWRELSQRQFSQRQSSHLTAVLQALFVTFLWSTSWVLIKIGLADIPALTFAGLRYVLAFLCLLPIFLRSPEARLLPTLPAVAWLRLLGLGLLLYTVTQGAQFLGLAYLPAVTVNLMLSLTSIVVALLGILLLAERPSLKQ